MKETKFIFTLMLGCSLAATAKADTSKDNCERVAGEGNCVQIGIWDTYYALSGAANNQTMTIYGTTGSTAATVPTNAFYKSFDSTFPKGVKSLKTSGNVNIGDSAFEWAGLTSVDLTGVQSIGDSAFAAARGLTSANLTGVQSIGKNAFQGATGLTSIIISDSLLDSAGNILGYSCDVNNVCAGVNPNAFNRTGLNTIYCPAGKSCGNNFGISGDNIISYSKENGKYVLDDGTVIGTYQVATPSGPQPSQPSQPTKPQRADIRIYTIDEANAAAGKKNTVKIRYK